MAKYVAVTGAVGAGATTLATFIAQNWVAETLFEGQIEAVNPFFEDAQRDPERWAFASQTHFLAASARRHEDLRLLLSQTNKPMVLEDRTPFEHTGVYVKSARSLGHIVERELDVLMDLARVVERGYEVPAVLVYREMTDDQLVERVTVRSRPGESADFARLKSVHDAFETFVSEWDRSPIVRIGHEVDLHLPEGREQAALALGTHLGPRSF